MHYGNFPFRAADDTQPPRPGRALAPPGSGVGPSSWGGRGAGPRPHQRHKHTLPEERFWRGATEHWRERKIYFFFLPWQKRKPFQTGSTLICSKVRTHNLSSGELGLTFLLVSTNQSIYCVNQTISFQSRVLFLACGCHEKNCRKMYLWKITPSSVVSWDGRFCYMFTHPSPGGCNFVTF